MKMNMQKIKAVLYIFFALFLLNSVVAVAPVIDNYLPTDTTPTETEPYDTVFFLNWTDGDSPSWNVSWWVNDTIEETHWLFKTQDYFTFDGEDYADGIYNISAQIYDGSKNDPFNTSWLLTMNDGALVQMIENTNYTLSDDIMQVNWTLMNESTSDSTTPKLYVNGIQVRGAYWDKLWQKNIPTPNASYGLYATDVFVEKNGTILITNFNEGDILWYDQSTNYLTMKELGEDIENLEQWDYGGNDCQLNNSHISMQSITRMYLPEVEPVVPEFSNPIFPLLFNYTKTDEDCVAGATNFYSDNLTAVTLEYAVNWTSSNGAVDIPYRGLDPKPANEWNESLRTIGLYGGVFSMGDFAYFGQTLVHKRNPCLWMMGYHVGTPEYSICAYDFADNYVCMNESSWNWTVGSPRDMTVRDDDFFMVYNYESGGTNYAYTGYYDFYGRETSDNLRNTAVLENLGNDLEVWGSYYANGYLYAIASDTADNNTLYKYKLSYNLSDLQYLNGTSVSAQNNDNITLKILGDEGQTKGRYEEMSFLYGGAPAGNTAPSITSHSPQNLSFSIAEPNSQEFLLNWSDSENATVIVTWYQDSVLKNTNTTSSQDVSWTFDGNYTSAGTYNITGIVSDGEYTDWLNWTMTVTDTPAVLTEDSYTVTVTQAGNTRTTEYVGYLTISVTDFIVPVNYTVAKSRLNDVDTRKTINYTINSGNIISLAEDSSNMYFEIQPTLTTGSKTFSLEYTNTIFGSGGSDLATIDTGVPTLLTLAVEDLPDKASPSEEFDIDVEIRLEGEYVDVDTFHAYIFDDEQVLRKVVSDVERTSKGKYTLGIGMSGLDAGDYLFSINVNKGGRLATHEDEFTIKEVLVIGKLQEQDTNTKIAIAIIIVIVAVMVMVGISAIFSKKN